MSKFAAVFSNFLIIRIGIKSFFRKTAFSSNNGDSVKVVKNQIAYGQLEAMILGLPLTEMDQLDLDKYVIRFGWISKDMYQLEWVPIRKLLLKYLDNQLTSTEKNKFQQICRTLAIPMRTMTARRKEHLDKMKRIAEAEAVEPIKVMETAEQV